MTESKRYFEVKFSKWMTKLTMHMRIKNPRIWVRNCKFRTVGYNKIMIMAESGRYSILIGSIKNQTRPMTNVQHNQNGSSWHSSFSSNAQNHSVLSKPSVYSAVQTLGANKIPNALHPETERLL